MGLEKEFFLRGADGQFVICPDHVPMDGCGYLAEARSLPFTNIEEAVYSLKADIHRIRNKTDKLGLTLDDSPIGKVDKKVRMQARRKHAKETIKFRNLYNHEDHRHTATETPAGVHISFTNPETVHVKDEKRTINGLFDFVRLFKGLDKAFALEIKAAKRNPGFYELKPDGRIEYRSLPANVDLNKVINVVNGLLKDL
jgi:hypothetical protein